MAVGDFGSVVDTEAISLTNTPHNQPYANLFRVTSGMYALFWRRDDLTHELASIAITDAGAVTAAPVDEAVLFSIMGAHHQAFIQHPEFPNVFICQDFIGTSDIDIHTFNVADDGTITGPLDTLTHTVSSQSEWQFLHLSGNNFGGISGGGITRIWGFSVASDGTIATITGPTGSAIGAPRTWGRVHGNIAFLATEGGANNWAPQTMTFDDDGTFDDTVLDLVIGLDHDINRSHVLILDADLGIVVISSHDNVTGGVDDSFVRPLTVDSDGNITAGTTLLDYTKTDVNITRPMLGFLGSRTFMEFEETAGVITSYVSDTDGALTEVDTLATGVLEKGPFFALVVNGTPGIFAVVSSSAASAGITITTFEVDAPAGGAEPVVISAQVGMIQREILLL